MSGNIVLAKKKSGILSPIGYRRIDVTSHATDIFRQLSPLYLGPIDLYDGYISRNMENAWQYTKVCRNHIGISGDPMPEYFEWALSGWYSPFANPHACHGLPAVYHWWAGRKLDRITAQREIALPLYCTAAKKTEAYAQLKQLYDSGKNICLIDYDGFDYESEGLTPNDIISSPTQVLGQSFMLKWLLEGII